MENVARVVLYKLAHGTDTNYNFPFQLPLGMSAEEADAYLARGSAVHGRRMVLEPPTEAWTLGLDEADGAMVRMIRDEWDWVLMPSHVLRVEPWVGTRIGRWADPEAEAEATPVRDPTLPAPSSTIVYRAEDFAYRAEDFVDLPGVSTPRLAPDGDPIPISDRRSSVRPTTASGRVAGIVVHVQTYALRDRDPTAKKARGHTRFVNFYFQVGDAEVPDARALAALLESGREVPGWRVYLSSHNLSGVDGPSVQITGCRDHVLRRSDVRAIRFCERELTIDDMETQS